MKGKIVNRAGRHGLLAGVAVLALAAIPLRAQEQVPAIESSRYTMQVLTQSFDGEREFSQSQALAYARMRRGEESWIELDFGDGAVVIEQADGTAAGRFANVSGTEAGLGYDYATRRLSGGSPLVRQFHNTFVRRQLGRGPTLGQDASWTRQMMPSELGVVATSDEPLTIAFSRQYFSHGGRDYVLLHYRVAAFAYTANGRRVVQWGEGAALTDPGFGTMYWNSALHRAVRDEQDGSSGRPYRRLKTLIALDEQGRAMVDPADIPQLAPVLARLSGAPAQEVLGFVEGDLPDHTPLMMANALDIMALSIAEDSPNQLGEVTSQLTNGTNGLVMPDASYTPEQGEVAQSMNAMLSSLNTIATQLTAAIQQQQAAGLGQAPETQSMSAILSELGTISGQIAGANLGTVQPDPTASAALRNMLASLGTMSSQMTQTLAVQPAPQTSLNQMASSISQLGNQLSTTIATTLAANQRAAQLAQFDATLAQLDARGDELAAREPGILSDYAEASAAREAMLANQTPENSAQLAESADTLFRSSRAAWRLAEELRREAVTAYEAIRTNGTADQLVAAMARIGEAERLVAEAQRYITYAEGAAFVQNELETGEQLRLEDVSTTNNSGGEGGGGAAGGGDGSGGGGGGVSSGDVLDGAVTASGGLNTTMDLADKTSAITEGVNVLVAEGTRLGGQLETLQSQVSAIKAAIAAEASAYRPSTAYTTLQNLYEAQKAELASLEAVFSAAERTGALPPPGMVNTYIRLTGEAMDSATELARLATTGEAMVAVPSARQLTLAANLQSKAAELGRVEQALAALGARAGQLAPLVQSLSETQFAALVRSFGESPAARVLSGVATGLNVVAVGQAAYNTTQAAGTDLGTGDAPALTRNYGMGGTALLGLEIAAMAGNFASGNIKGLFFDMAAISVGSVTDIVIAAKGVHDANLVALEAEMDYYNTELRGIHRRVTAFEQQMADLGQDISDVKDEIDNFEDEVDARADMAQQLLDERRRAREERERAEEAARLADEEGQRRADEEAARLAAEAEARRTVPNEEEWEDFREDIAEAMEPDYPTVSAEERARIGEEAAARREAERQAEIARHAAEAAALAAELAAAEAERQAREAEMRRISEEAIARREEEARQREEWLEEARNRELAISELEVSELEIEPVVFDPPVWEPPVWEPPEWVPPEFDPPEITPIDWTDFEDDDYPDSGNLAYEYENLSGIVATDLSRWAEWLATQDIRRLERLALLAGYPNLASALADAENIIRMSQDEGYRRWAMQAPSCGGYVGCGPSYLERWHMKSSIVALGDILAQSREIFSSGGFSDVGITGNQLSYLLRDHGAQDGDIVQITIQQFGRTIYTGRLTLTNAGDEFDQLLRPGVASLTILAENEGSASPNTAQIRLDNVVSGEAVQTYNLRTNQTAVLRIETNASGTTTGGGN